MPDRPHLPALTGLRFLAAAAVAFAHLPHLHVSEEIPPILCRLFAEGFLGVPFFFVLSGFVLAYTYHDRFPALTRANCAKYYTARVARVGPVHWLTMAAATLVPIPGAVGGGGLPALVVTALLMQTWVVDSRYLQGFNSVSWSLSVEAWFYLWLPVVLWQIAKRKYSARALFVLAAGAWAAEASFAAYAAAHPSLYRVWFAALCPAGRFAEFLVGVAVGITFAKSNTASSRRNAVLWSALELATVLLVGGLILASVRVPLLLRQTVYYTPAMAALVFAFAHQRGIVSRTLSTRIPVYLGEISFSFFMVHGIVFSALTPLAWPDVAGPWGRAVIHLVAAAVVAAVVNRWFETPIRKWATGSAAHRFRFAGFFSTAIRRSSIRR
jgi:peptidoglycan/LPS O-acetylase OafA/YrhL